VVRFTDIENKKHSMTGKVYFKSLKYSDLVHHVQTVMFRMYYKLYRDSRKHLHVSALAFCQAFCSKHWK